MYSANIKKKIVDGKPVVVLSQEREMSEGFLRNELDRIGLDKSRLLQEVERLKKQYQTLLKHEEFYREELAKLNPQLADETDIEDIFDIE